MVIILINIIMSMVIILVHIMSMSALASIITFMMLVIVILSFAMKINMSIVMCTRFRSSSTMWGCAFYQLRSHAARGRDSEDKDDYAHDDDCVHDDNDGVLPWRCAC